MTVKRILPVLLIICLLVGLLPITASAISVLVAEWWIEGGVYYTVYADSTDSDDVLEAFEDGWNDAMGEADKDHSKMMHFKMHRDWNGDDDGDLATYWFNSGPGFNWWAIYIQDGAQVTLDLNGCIINRRRSSVPANGNGEVIYVDTGATLIIEDSNPDALHYGTVNNEGLWRPGSGSSTIALSGGIITGGYTNNGAGGIHMKGGTHVVLKGGTIAGNLTTEDIGGGGGIELDNDGALLEMYDGASIKYNVAANNDGGGVEVWDGAFVMYGGEISHNRAKDFGGGVDTYEDDGIAFQMFGGEISYNSADYGGGAYIDNSFVIDGGSFLNNTASTDGGGLYFTDDDSPVIKKATVLNNRAEHWGGGIYVNTDDVQIRDTEIAYNIAPTGGGIYCRNDSLALSGCSIHDNTASGEGGGVYLYGDKASIGNCTFIDNNALKGTEIHIADSSVSSCTYTVSNTEIRDSKGVVGLYVGTKNKITLSGKNLIGSQDSAWMYVAENAKISAEGATYDSAVWLDSEADIGSIISTKTGAHNVTGFHYTDGRRGLFWNNDPYSEEYRTIKIVSLADVEQITTETVPTGILETLDYTAGIRHYDLLKGTYTYSSCNDATLDNQAIFYYSDGYFDRTPDQYDAHLATMSMNLAMSGFYSSRGQTGTYYYQDGSAHAYPSETDYSNRHASVRQLLSDIGVSDENIYVNDDYLVCPTPNTIGVAVGQKQLRYADGTETGYTLVPVVIRSANYEQEWVSNVTLGDGSENGGEAKGFSTAADIAMDVVEDYIADFGLTDAVAAGKVKFWVVGYSRGGATANLLSKRLTDIYSDPSNGGSQVFGYCFEAPQGGVDNAVRYASHTYHGQYLNIHNCINICDLVPMVGPIQMGFHRYGVDHRVPGDPEAGKITATEKQVTNDSPYTRRGGEDYTRVTTYADNEPYYVKPVNGFVTDRDDADLKKYYSQRFLAEAQLRSVCPSVVLDDYFYTATFNLLTGAARGFVTEAGDVDEIPRMDEWIKSFVAELVNTSLPSRTFFADTPVILQKDGSTIGGLTFEQAVRNVIGMVFTMPSEKMDALVSLFGLRWVLLVDAPDLAPLWDDALGDWDEVSEQDQYEDIQHAWTVLTDFGIGSVLSKDEYAALEEAWPTLADVLFYFVSKDYDHEQVPGVDDTMAYVGTLLNNISRIGANHYPEINLAWLRSYDSFYTTDIPGTETGVSSHIVLEQPTTAEAPCAHIGKTVLSPGGSITLRGSRTMTLSTEADGDAIYYTVSKNGAQNDTPHLYRSEIELPTDGEHTSYVISTYAMQYGAKSEIATYNVTLLDTVPKCRIVSRSLTLSGGLDMNFYCEIENPERAETAYMKFSVFGSPYRFITIDLKDATRGADGLYCFTCPLNALELNQDITADFYFDGKRVATRTYSTVAEYLEDILEDYGDDEKLVRLANAIADYGYFAQIALSQEYGFVVGDYSFADYYPMPRFSDEDPDTTVDLSAYAATLTGSLDQLGQVTRQLALDGRTDLYINVNCEDGYVPNVTVTDCNGADAEFSLVPLENGAYRIIIPEIAAHELGDFYTLHFFDGGKEAMTARICALSYAYSILQSPTRTPELKNAMAALAEYYFAAIDYAGR